jgi:hypothetical protein
MIYNDPNERKKEFTVIDKTELMKEFDRARTHMRVLLAELDTRVEIYPEWTIKELLAHLAGWDDATILALQAHSRGETPPLLAVRGIDFYNDQTVGERANLNLAQIIREWELVREQLLGLLAALPPEKLEDPILSPWGQILTIVELVKVMADHEEEHAEAIEKLLRKGNT